MQLRVNEILLEGNSTDDETVEFGFPHIEKYANGYLLLVTGDSIYFDSVTQNHHGRKVMAKDMFFFGVDIQSRQSTFFALIEIVGRENDCLIINKDKLVPVPSINCDFVVSERIKNTTTQEKQFSMKNLVSISQLITKFNR